MSSCGTKSKTGFPVHLFPLHESNLGLLTAAQFAPIRLLPLAAPVLHAELQKCIQAANRLIRQLVPLALFPSQKNASFTVPETMWLAPCAE